MNKNQYTELYLEASADLQRLETEVEEMRRLCNYLKEKTGQQSDNSDSPAVQNTTEVRVRSNPESRRFAKSKQIDAARVVLSEASEPIKTREIARRLVDGGFPSDDLAKLKTSLFTTMTRKTDIFEKAGAGLWALAKKSDT